VDNSDFTGDGLESLTITVSGNTVVKAGSQFGLNIKGSFGDYLDGSESHYFLVKVPSSAWLLAGGVIVTDPNGVPAGTYIQVDANGLIDTDTGIANTSLILKAPENVNPDFVNIDFEIYAVAEETSTGDIELTDVDNLEVTDASIASIQVVSGDQVLLGTSNVDNLTGGSGDDLLVGYGDGDILVGGSGNDLLIGGDGADTLTGDAGDDTYAINALSEGIDTITSFETGADAIDLSELFVDVAPGINDLTDLADYLQIVPAGGGSQTVQARLDTGDAWTDIATLSAVTGGSVTIVVDGDTELDVTV
jgi:Ca2+-binding RTX toxin-like protein